LATAFTSRGAILGPYSADANTLHLWHIDEATLDVADDPSVSSPIGLTSIGAGGGNALGTPSYAGYGNAYSGVTVSNTGLFAKSPTNSSADDTATATFWNQTNGAFTYELIMRVDIDPSTFTDFVGLVTMDQDSGTRPFTWYLNPQPESAGLTMFFSNGSASIVVESPVLSIVQGHWYHAAVTYTGAEATTGNMQMYWTDMGTDALPDGSATLANLVHTGTFTADLTGATGDFALGAEARSTQTIFVPEPTGIALGIIGGAAMALYCRPRRRKISQTTADLM
jgi:hypothetical protein